MRAAEMKPLNNFFYLLLFTAGNFSTSSSRSDYYEDLGLDQNADSKKIKESYYSLSKQFHPDLNAGNPEAAQKFHVTLLKRN